MSKRSVHHPFDFFRRKGGRTPNPIRPAFPFANLLIRHRRSAARTRDEEKPRIRFPLRHSIRFTKPTLPAAIEGKAF